VVVARHFEQGRRAAQMNPESGVLPAGMRRTLLTVCTMTATIMQALDMTIANVALPYMQGSLSASLDQISWVLTSYIVAAAVMTAPVGWLSDRFGRKKLFIVCVGGFTVASLLCALAQNIEQIVAFRLLQGMCGAALVPLSQSVMLDAYPIEQRGQAMGIWGVGIMLGPIMGPTLGGWLTENYSWHWVFLVNLPVGILTVFGLLAFMDETKRHEHLRFDWFGFVALAAGIGAMQLMLDRGEQLGWFGSPEIVAELIISIVGFYYFFAHSLTTGEPFVRFAIFRDRNFLVGCFFMLVMGLMLFSSMALSAPFIQNVLGYPIETAGWVLASRGLGTLIGMAVVSRLLRLIEARYLIMAGLMLTAFTMYQMTGFTDNTSGRIIMVYGLVQGFGMGLFFIPLSTVAFLTLAPRYRTDGTAMLTLVRNVASSAGISVVIANLSSKTTMFHSQLAEHINPFNDALMHPDVARWLDLATDQGRALADQMITLQAVILAYANDFMLLTVICVLSIPFVVAIGSTASLRGKKVAVEVME
jgi:DHA2 family multidrug resistance protein